MSWLIASAFIGSAGSRVLIAVLAAVAVALLVVAVTVVLGRREAKVERQLAGYELPDPVVGARLLGWVGNGRRWLDAPETAVVQQAVAMTSRFADRTGLLAKTELAARVGRRAVARRGAALLHAGVRGRSCSCCSSVIASPLAGLIGGGGGARRADRLPQLPRARVAGCDSNVSCPTRSRCSRARCVPVSR